MEKIASIFSTDSLVKIKNILLFFPLLLFSSCVDNLPKLTLNDLFSDGMVLQSETLASIWGQSKAHQQITVSGSWGEKVVIKSDKSGNWSCKLKTPNAGGPFAVKVTSKDELIIINDIYQIGSEPSAPPLQKL